MFAFVATMCGLFLFRFAECVCVIGLKDYPKQQLSRKEVLAQTAINAAITAWAMWLLKA